ncbi:hypothetical protein SDC9_105205 [bioreactor metagenome]|uniref:Uncharacterized protein n=1 Tax=bioreactor metagenome TaxID=1076179 RepID=A0A645B9M7_9ZZZZ
MFALARRKFSDDLALGPLGQRHQIVQTLVADDHPGGVNSQLPVDPFQHPRMFKNPRHLRLFGDHLAQLGRILLGFFQGHFGIGRNLLGDPVARGEIVAEHPRHILDHRFGFQGAVGADLGHAVLAVFVPHVVDHFAAAVFAEVDVEVRRTHPFRVEEAFEQQIVLDRVDVGDQSQVGHQAARAGAASRSDRNAVILGVFDEIADHQKIRTVLGPVDHVEFEIHAFHDPALLFGKRARGARIEAVAVLYVAQTDAAQIFFFRRTSGNFENRIVIGLGGIGKIEIAAFRHADGIGDGFGDFVKNPLHLLGTLEIEFRKRKAEPVGIAELALRLDAEHDLMRLGVLFFQIMDVIGGDHGQLEFPGQLDEAAVGAALLLHAVVHDFKIEVLPAENIAVLGHRPGGALHVVIENRGRDFAADAGRQTQQSFMMLAEQIAVHPGLIVHAVDPGFGKQFAQRVIPFDIFRQQHQVVAADMRPRGIAVEARRRRDINLAADDRPAAAGAEGVVHIDRTADIAVVGNGAADHVVRFGHLEQAFDRTRPVKQTVVRVNMQMNEISSHFDGIFLYCGS